MTRLPGEQTCLDVQCPKATPSGPPPDEPSWETGLNRLVRTSSSRSRAWAWPQHNANCPDTVDGPAIAVPPLQQSSPAGALAAETRFSTRTRGLKAHTGSTELTRRDIVAEVRAGGAVFDRQTVYRRIRWRTGGEPGSAHRDLEDLGGNRLRVR